MDKIIDILRIIHAWPGNWSFVFVGIILIIISFIKVNLKVKYKEDIWVANIFFLAGLVCLAIGI